MNRNNATPNLTLILYFSFIIAGVIGITPSSVFAKSDIPVNETTESRVVAKRPVLETFAWFWDKKDPEETPESKSEAVEPPKQKSAPKETPWWKPDAFVITEPDSTPEIPEKKMKAAPPVEVMEKAVEETKPAMEMKAAPPVEVMEKAVEETKPAMEMKTAPPVEVMEKAVEETKPGMEMKAAPPVEVMEKAVEETKPAMEMKAAPPVKAMEKTVEETKPGMEMKAAPPVEVMEKAVEETKPVMKKKVAPPVKAMEKTVEETKPVMKKKVAPPVKAMEKTVEETKPVMKKKEAVPEIKVTSKGFLKGPKACEECHEGEFKIWKKTKHHTSFRTVHREPKDSAKPSPKKILKNVAGAKRMKRNKTCYLCHYTLQQKDADAKPVAKSGTSCESCHGASSEYLAIHDNYGGEGIKREDEAPEHKKERIEKSAAAGLIWPSQKYQVVENCMTCHGLAHPELSGDVLAKMLGAGHPINPDFEAVKYSQGTVRHRYTPEDITNNREMTESEKAELFVIGHAAALVSAREAMSKSNEPKYTDAQNKRAKNAEAVLSLLSDIPEAAQLVASPNRSNALKLVNALAGKDLTGKVGSMLPAKSDYK